MTTEYGKITTLLERDENTFKVIDKKIAREEFLIPQTWHVEEKLHGTNIRLIWDGSNVTVRGRTDEGQVHSALTENLINSTRDAFDLHFTGVPVTVYGEGIGPKIQKGSGNYNTEMTIVVFDVMIGSYWLEPDNVTDVANKLGLQRAPILFTDADLDDIIHLVKKGFNSKIAEQNTGAKYGSEGIIAKTVPGLFNRQGHRLMFKLKTQDFAKVPQPTA